MVAILNSTITIHSTTYFTCTFEPPVHYWARPYEHKHKTFRDFITQINKRQSEASKEMKFNICTICYLNSRSSQRKRFKNVTVKNMLREVINNATRDLIGNNKQTIFSHLFYCFSVNRRSSLLVPSILFQHPLITSASFRWECAIANWSRHDHGHTRFVNWPLLLIRYLPPFGNSFKRWLIVIKWYRRMWILTDCCTTCVAHRTPICWLPCIYDTSYEEQS